LAAESKQFEDEYRAAVGAVLSRLRAERGWSLRDFGKRVDTAHTSLYAAERGELTPGVDVLGRVAAACGLSLPELLLMVVVQMAPPGESLAAVLGASLKLSPKQRKETLGFIDYLNHRDRTSNPER
jgi:transcriptional regulator with XRE-family HTH domain